MGTSWVWLVWLSFFPWFLSSETVAGARILEQQQPPAAIDSNAKNEKTGSRSSNSRIIGGSTADPTRYPYYTLLKIRTSDNGLYQCGGSLVAPDMVLSAAHCTEGIGVVTEIVAFVNYTNMFGLTGYEHKRTSILTLRHAVYNPRNQVNDILLLKLESEVPVPVVEFNTDVDAPVDGEELTVMGLGVTSLSATAPAKRLQVVNVNLVAHSDCNDANSYMGTVFKSRMLCANAPGKDSCFGDSGGPLVIAGNNNSDVQVGITSWGYQCARSNFPGVYTRVSAYATWIRNHICLHSGVKPTTCPDDGSPALTLKPTTSKPTSRPTDKPTSEPTSRPTDKPTSEPTSRPTDKPTSEPNSRPTDKPTSEPTSRPTDKPTSESTSRPTNKPTSGPTSRPMDKLTSVSSVAPSVSPSQASSRTPSMRPSMRPSKSPAPASESDTPSASPDSTIVGAAPTLQCFPGDATVVVKGRGTVSMKELQIGNHVLVSSSTVKTNANERNYEPVYSFGHWNVNDSATYLQFDPIGLQISSNHMVFRHQQHGGNSTISFQRSRTEAVPASMVQIGDILALHGDTDKRHSIVTSISQVTHRGMYAPLTASGRIVVNGVVCSTYITFQQNSSVLLIGGGSNENEYLYSTGLSFQWLCHVFELPHRLWCQYGRRRRQQEEYDVHGIATSVAPQLQLAMWIFQPKDGEIPGGTICMQVLLLIPLVIVAGALDLMERIIMMLPVLPVAVLVVALFTIFILQNRRQSSPVDKSQRVMRFYC